MSAWKVIDQGYEDVIFERHADGIVRLTINRAERRNALRYETYEELTKGIIAASDDPGVGVIVITGAGNDAFCSGGDVSKQRKRTPSMLRRQARRVMNLNYWMRNCGVPIIAAVKGFAIGGGHELHLACDLTIAADNAIFGQVGPRVGSIAAWGAIQNLALVVGDKKAREIVYMTRRYSAQDALQMGLCNVVVPLDKFDEEVMKWCQDILDKSPTSIRVSKLNFNFFYDLTANLYYQANEALALFYQSPEQSEGPKAFLEKRKPNYRQFRQEDPPVTT